MISSLKKDGISQEQLSNIVNIDRGIKARAIKKLEQEGYVIKNDEKDKSPYRMYVTEKGMNIEPQIRKVLMNWTDVLTNNFMEEDQF